MAAPMRCTSFAPMCLSTCAASLLAESQQQDGGAFGAAAGLAPVGALTHRSPPSRARPARLASDPGSPSSAPGVSCCSWVSGVHGGLPLAARAAQRFPRARPAVGRQGSAARREAHGSDESLHERPQHGQHEHEHDDESGPDPQQAPEDRCLPERGAWKVPSGVAAALLSVSSDALTTLTLSPRAASKPTASLTS